MERNRPYDPSPVWMRAGWVTWLIMGLCVVITLATWFGSNVLTDALRWSTHDIASGQWWRMITPVFLHFNAFNSLFAHILFNCLWWLMLGGLIESQEGSLRLILLFLLSALCGNIVWLRGFDMPEYRAVVQPPLFYACIIYMLAGFVQLIPGMADWVHAAGLATGLLIALPFHLAARHWLPERE